MADIIIAAVGIPKLVKGDWVKKGAIVIDVGINKTNLGLIGDVDLIYKKNRLLIFDGILSHRSAVHQNPKNRYTIAFKIQLEPNKIKHNSA